MNLFYSFVFFSRRTNIFLKCALQKSATSSPPNCPAARGESCRRGEICNCLCVRNDETILSAVFKDGDALSLFVFSKIIIIIKKKTETSEDCSSLERKKATGPSLSLSLSLSLLLSLSPSLSLSLLSLRAGSPSSGRSCPPPSSPRSPPSRPFSRARRPRRATRRSCRRRSRPSLTPRRRSARPR